MPIVIYPFMLKELNLSGADLVIYAFLFSRKQDTYTDSFRSMGRELNINIHTVLASVGRLVGKDLIIQTNEGICVKIDTVQEFVSKMTHEPLGEGGRNTPVSKLTHTSSKGRVEGNCAKNDTTGDDVSKLTQTDVCAKIDTKLKLHRKEKK